MKYIGSKRRLKKSITPILQKAIDDTCATVYLEPFGGGRKCNRRYSLRESSVL